MIDSAPRKIILLALACLTGCTQLPWHKTPAPTLDQLRAQHRYVSALTALDANKKKPANYQNVRDAILDEANSYQHDLLNQANTLVVKQNYAEAFALIQNARAELPAADELAEFDESFSAARDRYMQRYLDELVWVRALTLSKEHALYQALEKAAIEPDIADAVARHRDDVIYFAPLIADKGKQALTQNEFVKAAQLLSIANQLTPSPALAKQLKTAEQAIVQGRQKQQIARINEREQRYRDLHNVLQKALQEREFFAARDLLSQAKALNTHSDELDSMQRELDEAINAFVVQQIDMGNRQYAEGHIENALQSWRNALALTPTAELQEKIDKAQKFIDRLQQLQQKTNR